MGSEMAIVSSHEIAVKDITRIFQLGDQEIRALDGLNIQISKDEFVVVLGPSGSGKTTLLNMIGGIDQPSSGEIWINGEDITKWNQNQLSTYRRNKVGWIFQFFNLVPALRAWENVGLALEFQGQRKEIKQESVAILEKVGLSDKVDRFPSQLSGGEQQRVAIARALVKKPSMIVADEPTGNLDWSTGQIIADLMHDLQKQYGGTYIVVSHDISLTEKADRVFHLRDGKIIKIDEKTEGIGIAKARTGDMPESKKVH